MWRLEIFAVGLLMGTVAKLLSPGKDPGGFLFTALVGIAGAFAGRSVSGYSAGDPGVFFASVVGSVVLLGLYRIAIRSRLDSDALR